jgi:hypothetical protein
MGLGRFRIIICRDEKNTFQPTGIKAWKIKGASVLPMVSGQTHQFLGSLDIYGLGALSNNNLQG